MPHQQAAEQTRPGQPASAGAAAQASPRAGALRAQPTKKTDLGPTNRQRIKQLREEARARRSAWTDEQHEARRWQLMTTVPIQAGGWTWVYGNCSHLVAALTEQPLTTAASAAFLAATAQWVVRFGLKKVWVSKWSLRFWLSGAVATIWSVITTWTGPSWLMTGVLTVAVLLLGARWWRAHRLPWPVRESRPQLALTAGQAVTDEAGADQEAELTEDVDEDAQTERVIGRAQILERWELYLAAKSKPFVNSVLSNHRKLINGHQFDVDLDADKNTVDDLFPRRGKIAAIMGMKPADILLELHPTGDNSRGMLTVLTTNPLAKGIPYQGPRYDNGFIDAGMFADGTGWGSVQLTDHKNTVMNGLVCGDPGAGKSVFLENLGMSALHSKCWKVFYCDGSEDADSSSLLNDHMTWSEAGLAGAWAQLKAVKRYCKARGLENNALGPEVRGVNPSPQRLGLLWIIDEFHRLVKQDKEFAKEVEQVVRLGRKKGVAIWVATQGLDLSLDFAGISTLRDILTSRNVVAFYSSSTYAHTLISGVNMAPNTLPSDGGYAYLSRPGMSNRASMLRTDFAPDMTPWARELLDVPWDDLGLLAVKQIMDQHRVTPEMAREQAAARLDAFRLQLQLGLPDEPEAAEQTEQVDSMAAAASLFSDLLDQMPDVLDLTSSVPAQADGQRDDGEDGVEQDGDTIVMRVQHYDVLEAITGGTEQTGQIVEACPQWSRRTVHNALNDLRDLGKVHSPSQGRWCLVNQPVSA